MSWFLAYHIISGPNIKGSIFSTLCQIFPISLGIYIESFLRTPQKQKQNTRDKVNHIINKNRPSSNIDNLTVKDKNLQQPSSLSNAFNMYFCSAATELASKLKVDRHLSTYMKRKKINLSLRSSKWNRSLSTIRKYRHEEIIWPW